MRFASSARSSSLNRSLTADLDRRRCRAASLIEPVVATVTNADTPSSFIVRILREVGSAFPPVDVEDTEFAHPAHNSNTGRTMRSNTRLIAGLMTLLSICGVTRAQDFVFPAGFKTQAIATNGTTLNVRVGGTGPAIVLIHGYADTGDMWVPLAADLMRDHTVVVPDLRGMGFSAVETTGFTKRNEAKDIAGALDALNIGKVDVVGHDIGNMVAFAFAAAYRERTTRLVMMDAPAPGIGPWDE